MTLMIEILTVAKQMRPYRWNKSGKNFLINLVRRTIILISSISFKSSTQAQQKSIKTTWTSVNKAHNITKFKKIISDHIRWHTQINNRCRFIQRNSSIILQINHTKTNCSKTIASIIISSTATIKMVEEVSSSIIRVIIDLLLYLTYLLYLSNINYILYNKFFKNN